MKFRALMYREFRLSRKEIILQFGLLLAFIALTWGMLFSSNANEFTDGELSGMTDIIIMMTALIGSMSLLMDEIFKSDINSGWLNYSYALPITPFERTAARFVRRASVCLGSALLSLCNAAALCAHTGMTFGANLVVRHIIVFAAVIFTSLPNNIFILRSRSGGELKKAQTTAGLASVIIVVVEVLVIYLASDIDLAQLAESDTRFELPVFDAATLAWAIPLLLAVSAAGFFTAYRCLGTAYHGAFGTEKGRGISSREAAREISPKPAHENTHETAHEITHETAREIAAAREHALPAKTDGATGLLYKELKQNRLVFILTACAPLLLTVFPFCFSSIGVMTGEMSVNEMFEATTEGFTRALMCVTGLFIAAGLMGELFSGDDKKQWAYFVVSTPQGIRGYMYRKYVVTLMLNLIYMVSGIFADHLLLTVNYFVTGTELTTSMQAFYLSGVYLLMAISAFDIPFMVRYGAKKGSIVKMTVMLSLCTAGIAVFGLLPDGIKNSVVTAVSSLFNGEANDILALIAGVLPYIALAAFLISYKAACSMFMKGVNGYDK